MASAGTLLSDLDSSSGGGDGDLVQKILQDMSLPSGGQQRPIPPPLPASTPSSHSMASNSHMPMTMDSHIPTSHIIGNEHPTPADFAAAMTGLSGARPSEQKVAAFAAPVDPSLAMPGAYMGQQYAPEQEQRQDIIYPSTKKTLWNRLIDEAKLPFLVGLLFFVFSLPPIRVLFAHYLPRAIKHTGEFNLFGLMIVSLFVGGAYWVLLRIVAPLLSL